MSCIRNCALTGEPIRGLERRRSLRYGRESVFRAHVALMRKNVKCIVTLLQLKCMQLICACRCAIYKLQRNRYIHISAPNGALQRFVNQVIRVLIYPGQPNGVNNRLMLDHSSRGSTILRLRGGAERCVRVMSCLCGASLWPCNAAIRVPEVPGCIQVQVLGCT
ncbi:hypothetical protein EVAR_42657_1 [Eumeta japonica]|uniref:Uncharacterized protein n=1 Tax=Eumeta variegata TaxID=151549 RepID=A0A4C1YKS8_EUMVA|nr:hypothetical protein EVAR_42657_1 [Eumeta japonica]